MNRHHSLSSSPTRSRDSMSGSREYDGTVTWESSDPSGQSFSSTSTGEHSTSRNLAKTHRGPGRPATARRVWTDPAMQRMLVRLYLYTAEGSLSTRQISNLITELAQRGEKSRRSEKWQFSRSAPRSQIRSTQYQLNMLLSRGYHQFRPRSREIAQARLGDLRLIRKGRIEKPRKQRLGRPCSGSLSRYLPRSKNPNSSPGSSVNYASKRSSIDSFGSSVGSDSSETGSNRNATRKHVRLSWVREVLSSSGERRPSSSVLLEIRSLMSTQSLRSSLFSRRSSSSTSISTSSILPFPDEQNFPQRNKLVIELCCQRRPNCIHRQAAQLISSSEPTYVFHELFPKLNPLRKERDIWNSSILHLLAQWAKDASVMSLLSVIVSNCGSSMINSRNIDGDTFLHILARRWCVIAELVDDKPLVDLIESLSRRGFRFDIRNSRGYNVIASFVPENFTGFTVYTAPNGYHRRVVGTLRSLVDIKNGGRFLSESFATISLSPNHDPLSGFLSAFVSVFLWSETESLGLHETEMRLIIETRERFQYCREKLTTPIMPRPSLHTCLRDRTAMATVSIELLNQGADPNEYNSDGQTCLMALLERSSKPRIPEYTVTHFVKILMGRGAIVNLCDKEGNTALHYAVNAELPDVVQQLFEAGVDLDARNIEGMTGGDIAVKIYKTLRSLRESNAYASAQKMMVRFFDVSARRMGRGKKSLPEIPE